MYDADGYKAKIKELNNKCFGVVSYSTAHPDDKCWCVKDNKTNTIFIYDMTLNTAINKAELLNKIVEREINTYLKDIVIL